MFLVPENGDGESTKYKYQKTSQRTLVDKKDDVNLFLTDRHNADQQPSKDP